MLFDKQLIATKMRLPRLSLDLLARPRLLQMFEDNYNNNSLTIVSAPPGFGKTILVFQFIEQIDKPFIWYQLDCHDNDPETFMQYLCAGLAERFPDMHEDLLDLLENNDPLPNKIRSLLTLIINRLDQNVTDSLFLIFDNFHRIEHPLIIHFLEHLIEYLPVRTHLIFLTRTQFTINVSKQKLNGLVKEITEKELQLNKDETKQLLISTGQPKIKDETVEVIYSITEGWAVALSYFILSLNERKDTLDSSCIRIPNGIYDYIADEVFNCVSPELQEFLICTSILNKINSDVCNAILCTTNAAILMKETINKNLLICLLTEDTEAFRYYNLFQRFLQSRLGLRKTEFFERAGNYYLTHNPEKAVDYFIAADNYDTALKLVEEIGIAVLQRGQLQTITHWVNYIFGKRAVSSPWIVLLKGALLSYRGLFDEAELWIDKAIPAFKYSNDKTGLFYAIIHKSRILRYRTSYEESLKYIDKLIPLLDVISVEQLYDVIVEKSYNLWLIGDVYKAINIAEQAMNTSEKKGDLKTAAQIARYMTVLFYHTGDFTKAIENYERSAPWNKLNSEALELHTVDSFIARIYRDRGDLDKALQLMLQTLETKQSRGIIEDISSVYYQMATLFLDMKDYDKALTNLKLSKELFRKAGAGENNAFFKLIQALEGRMVAETGDILQGRQMIDDAVFALRGKSDFMLVVAQFFASVIYLRLNQLDKAQVTISEALQVAERIGMKLMISQCSGLLASILWKANYPYGSYVEQCLSLAAKERYLQMFITFSEFTPCIRIGLENNIEPDFIDEIIFRLGDKAVPLLLDLIKSAVPDVRIRSSYLLAQLGSDEVIKELELLVYDSDTKMRDHALSILQQFIMQTSSQPAGKFDQKFKTCLFVRCFGEFEVFPLNNGKTPLKWRTAKAKELFAYLLHNNPHVVSKERVLNDLWPDIEPGHASTLLHTNLFYVRKMLKTCGVTDGVLFNSSGYNLDLSEISCDAIIFHHFLNEVSENQSVAGASLEQVALMYHGLYLKEWDWAESARQNYIHLYSSALEKLALYYFNTGNYKKAEQWLKALLRSDPFQESAHQMLMKTYARTGNKIGISLHYKTLCRLLQEELEVEPDEQTRKLYHELCNI